MPPAIHLAPTMLRLAFPLVKHHEVDLEGTNPVLTDTTFWALVLFHKAAFLIFHHISLNYKEIHIFTLESR